jgi:hypothetical protein
MSANDPKRTLETFINLKPRSARGDLATIKTQFFTAPFDSFHEVKPHSPEREHRRIHTSVHSNVEHVCRYENAMSRAAHVAILKLIAGPTIPFHRR